MKKILYIMYFGVIGVQCASQSRDVQQDAIDFDRAYKADRIDEENEKNDARNAELQRQRDEEAARRAAAQYRNRAQDKSDTSYLGGSQESLYGQPQQQQARRTKHACCTIQ